MQHEGVPVHIRLFLNDDVLLDTVSDDGVFVVGAGFHTFKGEYILFTEVACILLANVRLYALVLLLLVFLCGDGDPVHTLLDGEQFVVIFLTAEPGGKTAFSTHIVLFVRVLGEHTIHVVVSLSFLIEHMDRLTVVHGLFSAVAHTEHFMAFTSEFRDLAQPNIGLRFCLSQDRNVFFRYGFCHNGLRFLRSSFCRRQIDLFFRTVILFFHDYIFLS